MTRVAAFIISFLALGAFIAADQAAAQQRRAAGARPGFARNGGFRAAPRMAAPRFRAAPRFAGPRFANTRRGTARAARRVTPRTRQLASPNQLNARRLRQQAVTQKRIDRLQQRANAGKLNPRAERELQRLQARQQLLNRNAAQPNQADVVQQQGLRRNGQPRITPDAARQGRFAAQFNRNPNWQARRAQLVAARIAARQAWRRHRRAVFVAWAGPVFWPYVYSDLFDYTFWPYAYDDAYWADMYDDFFDSVYWAGPSPYGSEYYVSPYQGQGGYAAAARPTARSREADRTAQQLCKDPGKGITAWPFEDIEKAVRPTDEQRNLLEDVKTAAAKAADDFKAACSEDVPMTPPGRLQAMLGRLQATLAAVRTVRPPLERFYGSLTDEQKARFNAIGPDIGQDEARAARSETQGRGTEGDNSCSGAKAGLTNLPVEAIEDAVQPTDNQQAALDRLREANEKAAQALQAACPDTIPLTPVGRLEVMEQRLNAMVNAANTVRPALDDFYASLGNEQKARFNALGSKQAKQ